MTNKIFLRGRITTHHWCHIAYHIYYIEWFFSDLPVELDFGITGSKVRIGIFCNYVRQITLVSATLEIFFIHHHTQYDVVTSDVHKYTVSKHVDKTMTRHDYTSWFKLSSTKLENYCIWCTFWQTNITIVCPTKPLFWQTMRKMLL